MRAARAQNVPRWLSPGLALAAVIVLWPGQGRAQVARDWLPDATTMKRAWALHPLHAAARQQQQAALAGLDQARAGQAEWSTGLVATRHRYADPGVSPGADWELQLERPWRSDARAGAAITAAQRQQAVSEADTRAQTRRWARERLAELIAWQDEVRTADAQARLLANLAEQHRALEARQRAGDAARLELDLSLAALAQARAAAEGSADRALERRRALERQLGPVSSWGQSPDLDVSPTADTPAPESPELTLSRAIAESARAQARRERADQAPEPVVGVRLSRLAGAREGTVSLSLTLPWPGPGRDAGVRAALARADAADAQARAVAQQAHAEALARQALVQRNEREAARQREAATHLEAVAEATARGVALGEGRLADSLAARRLAQDQVLARIRADSALEASRLGLRLEADQLWPGLEDAP